MLLQEDENIIKEYCKGETSDYKRAFDLLKKKHTKASEKRDLDIRKHTLRTSKFCKPYLETSETSVQCPSRIIFVVDFLDFETRPFEVDKKYCNFETRDNQEFTYDIVYIPISYEDMTLDIINTYSRQFFNECNTMVIYFEQKRSLFERVKATFNYSSHLGKLTKFLDFMKLFPISRTLFVATHDPSNAFDAFALQSDGFTRVINIKPQEYLGPFYTKAERVRRQDVEYSLVESVFTLRPQRLSCASWFKRFLYTAFECGKGRLIQRSGTCYMTTVFNTMVLGETLKRIFTGALNNYVLQHPDIVPEITKSFEETVYCPLLKDDRSKVIYIARFIYNIICKKNYLKSFIDVFESGSDEYFSSSKTGLGGGRPEGVMYQLLSLLGVNFRLCNGVSFYDPVYISSELTRDTTDATISSIISNAHLQKSKTLSDADCVMYYDNNMLNGNPLRGSKLDSFLIEKGFEPEVCVIAIRLNKKDKKTIGHGIMGFKCNGIYKVYDSGLNQIFDCNWYDDRGGLSTLTDELFYNWNKNDNYESITNTHIIYVIYTNKKSKLAEKGMQCNVYV